MEKTKKHKRFLWIKNIGIRYIIIFMTALAVFLAIILLNYFFISDKIKDGVKSQMMFESFQKSKNFSAGIESCTNALKMSANELDEYITGGVSANATDYIFKKNTANYKNVIGDGFGSLFGCYKGETYICEDGDIHYDPTEKEWYKVAVAADGEVALSAPYKEEGTGRIILTASKLLSDKKSVLACDFTIDDNHEKPNDMKKGSPPSNENEGKEAPGKMMESDRGESVSFIIFSTGYIISSDDDEYEGENIFDEQGFLGNEEDLRLSLTNAVPHLEAEDVMVNYDNEEYDVNIRELYDKIYIVSAVSTENALFKQKKLAFCEMTAILVVMIILFTLIRHIIKKNMETVRLQEEKKRAEGANEAKSAFLSNMSHEIRTPINAVLGMNEMVLRECDDDNILAYSESIKTAGSTLLGIINDILDFSKIEAGKMEIIPVDYDLSSVLNDLVNMVQTRADDKGLLLELKFAHDIPHYLNGDEIRIKQVITNILTNAVKYTKKGTITFTVKYERAEDDPDSIMLYVAVRDTGIGIKREDMSKLFSEFERIEEERNRNIEGTGLGMNITRSLLHMMNSTLKVESTYGEGSEFSFSIRQKVVKWDPLGDYAATYRSSISAKNKYREKFTAPQAHVLVIDDTPMNLMVFKSLLKMTRIQIDTANSGDEGISQSLEKKYDIIFLDHMMPKKDGIQTLKEMKAEKNNPNLDTPTVCLTANAISGAREQYLSEGFDDYLTKPIDPQKLEEMLLCYLPKDKIEAPDTDTSDAPQTDSALPKELLEIEEIDTDLGISHCGDASAYIDTVKAYESTVSSNVRELEDYWNSRDIKNTTVKIHALKSTSRVIGAEHLGSFAERLENAGNSGDVTALEQNVEKLIDEYRALGEKLSAVFGNSEEDSDDKPLIPDDQLSEAYTAIKEFVEAVDYDSAAYVIESLGEFRMPDPEKERYKKLKCAAENFDWDDLTEILS